MHLEHQSLSLQFLSLSVDLFLHKLISSTKGGVKFLLRCYWMAYLSVCL